jgi:phospholipase/carboxylesterase
METIPLVHAWLDSFAASSGIRPDRTVLGGFSQGAMMTYALALERGRPRPLAAIALSGFVPSVPGFELDLAPPLPRFAIGHGVYDDMIGVEWSRQARTLLEEAGADVLYRESPMAHGIDPGFLAELAGWLEQSLPARV